jgi:hypothetical protein
MRVPIACTLSADDAGARIEEWRRFFTTSIDQVDRVGPQRLRVRLVHSPEALLAAIDLADREKACCGFFAFAVELELDGWWLAVAVPSEATEALADFVGLLPPR